MLIRFFTLNNVIVLVHGTWVSGKKIEPGVRVELNEGDTVRLGGSSRLYRLHWVPLSRAYDLDDPFVPPTDVLMPVKESEEEMNQVSFQDSKVTSKYRVANMIVEKKD